MSLSLKQLQNVCLLGSGSDQCRYLDSDANSYFGYMSLSGNYFCRKKQAIAKQKIDEKVEKHLRECSAKGIDPDTTGEPVADNCDGYIVLKHMKQGYDVKK